MGDVQQVPEVGVRVDEFQLTAVGLGRNVDAKKASETGAVDEVDGAHVGQHAFMLRRQALNFFLELLPGLEGEAAAADKSRDALGGDAVFNV